LGGVFAVAACYSPAVQDGAPCGDEDACPTGQTCDVDQRCRVQITDAGSSEELPPDNDLPDDSDFDGIEDSEDNCQMIANTDQRDHDADTYGDVCDNCPHIANASQAAILDTDSVGDACDPNQGRADTLASFEGFYETPVGWTLPAGWTVSGGKLTGVVSGTFSFAYLDAAAGSNVTVVTAGALTAPGGTANLGVIAHLTAMAPSQYYRCGIMNNGRADLMVHNDTAFMTLDQKSFTTPNYLDLGLQLDITGATLTCAARSGGQTANLAATSSAAAGTRIGLRVRDATGTFDSVAVFTH